ncbi:P-loop containing nucleoside triphosphate hydrolase protein, partial [Artomyces pyxidatus]
MPAAPTGALPTFSEIRDKTQEKFGKRPCLLQIKVCDAILRRKKNVVCCASTGFGKSLPFMMPLLFDETGIIIVVTALNLLGKQTVEALAAVGISAVAVSGKTDTEDVSKEIKDGRHRLVVVNPEVLMDKKGHFERMWKTKTFTDKLMSIVFDEAHCISTWGDFRPEYREINRLRYMIPQSVHFCLVSATLSQPVLADICDILHLTKANTEFFLRPNDRPNVFLSVQKMKYSASSFRDLDFLIPQVNGKGVLTDRKFIIFFDSIKEAEACCQYLQSRLGGEDKEALIWFHSVMSDDFREEEAAALAVGVRRGACGTDSIGMGVDISDILIVIQWKMTCTIEALWQRFGRGARDPTLEAIAILFCEAKHFDSE